MKTEDCIEVSIIKMRNTDKVSTCGLIKNSMMDNGKTESNMVRENSPTQKASQDGVCGRMGSV